MERKYYRDGVEAPQQKETENGIIYNYNSEANHDMLIADGYEISEDENPQISYEQRVVNLIRQRYTIDDELAIQRQRDEKPDEWQDYFDYCEWCKSESAL